MAMTDANVANFKRGNMTCGRAAVAVSHMPEHVPQITWASANVLASRTNRNASSVVIAYMHCAKMVTRSGCTLSAIHPMTGACTSEQNSCTADQCPYSAVVIPTDCEKYSENRLIASNPTCARKKDA